MFSLSNTVWNEAFLLGVFVCALGTLIPWGMSRSSLPNALFKAARLPKGSTGLDRRRIAHASREMWIAKREISIRIVAWLACFLLCLGSWMVSYALFLSPPHVDALAWIASGLLKVFAVSFAFSSTVALLLIGGDNLAALEVWSDSAGLLDRCASSDRFLLARSERAVLSKVALRAPSSKHTKRL